MSDQEPLHSIHQEPLELAHLENEKRRPCEVREHSPVLGHTCYGGLAEWELNGQAICLFCINTQYQETHPDRAAILQPAIDLNAQRERQSQMSGW